MMTAQIPDEFIYDGVQFSLVGLKGTGLFTPEDFGIEPRSRCSDCWRGHVMKYVFIEDALIFNGMLVNTTNPPNINGVEPQSGGSYFDYCYDNINLKTEFTGRILLAKDFIGQMYVHMGFQRPMAFRTVIEIHLEKGDITLRLDFSKKMEESRNQDISKGARPPSDSHKDIKSWINKSFSLDYEF